ncbi:MAG: cytochrome-c oxidase, cbb3-type subunit III [Zetaproteobacteria bacterium CG06_land_8_20_14_3_00_59_53]|nr:MAG: cytochrome-c oxidase, cbb3-type subunit III [Zetaproteobacteria bacterium CG2_30_59_37]PIO89375.1 MAG: cytochrome-c oxidase, cbb3-type subunit III [Zetaproteobacteria bacterium CG23_combo_of_CG06-09_8_20_14_all_59_86]PIQ65656.1 MAG: cytochrome-c oxidase, cbb3-type subunit III [Zetaproteobacteria bacterium CG11_big_fil_rev_8_21_14_0_20_59_439]PIU70673.1 MAG: cytochrome-c oxidase, cbb3-type subunit III [Zetaproteobacteria bacterium CG06_land_8_20_14_3_00_59_53]PIU98058.1 MAG: cytochrome-c
MAKQDKPQHTPDTGHEWDGIRELTNPPPRWWMIAFHASWIWCVVYFILYPAIPLVNDSTKGILGWTQIKEFKQAVEENEAVKAPFLQKVAAMDGQALLADDGLRNFAESSAKAIFGDYCAACHGAGGEGAQGLFPNLADDDWLYGGDIDTIIESITDGRQSNMPAHSEFLNNDELNQLTDTVVALSQGKATAEQMTQFDDVGCSNCHGMDGKGGAINDLGSGAANLTDAIWRFGSSREEIMRTIRDGVNQDPADVPNTRIAIMPAFGGKLSPEAIKMLAVKVHEFGGGK